MKHFLGKRVRRILQQLKGEVRGLKRTHRAQVSNEQKAHASKRPAISWVIPGKLAVGRMPRSEEAPLLAAAKIQVILSLCADSERPLPPELSQQFRCLRLVLPDSHYATEMKPEQLVAAVKVVHRSFTNNLPIFVHCLAGVERSPTVCIAYLCRHHHLELWEAVNWLKQVHPFAMPTKSQIRVVQEFLEQASTESKSVEPQ